MPIPFILGLVIGGGIVVAYNKRKEIGALFQAEQCSVKDNVKNMVSKGKEFATDVKDTLIAAKDTLLEAKDSIANKKEEIAQQRQEKKEGEAC